MQNKPWVSFCISTYRRAQMLEAQLRLLLRQTNPHFEIIISDNDPEGSGKAAVEAVNDPRVKYWRNTENLGMIKSFNKSIERASTEYIVMVTDDDPVEPHFLETMAALIRNNEGLSAYCGFFRKNKPAESIERISAQDFCDESLDPEKTTNLLWSSAVLRKEDVKMIGCIPDYGSPHLADHALIALTGAVKGGIIVNRMFSTLSSHDTNFSKSNLKYYLNGCSGFYDVMMKNPLVMKQQDRNQDVIVRHLKKWFFANIFTLRKYFTLNKVNRIEELDSTAEAILKLSQMKQLRGRYQLKRAIFAIKRFAGLLR